MALPTEIATTDQPTGLAAPSPQLLAQIRGTLDISSRDSISQYGISAQRDAADFADKILAATKNKDCSPSAPMAQIWGCELRRIGASS
jgi:uncharacterized protein YaaN involved in tellurite resistance